MDQISTTCPYKRDSQHDCLGRQVHPTSVCQLVDPDNHERARVCSRFFIEAELSELKSENYCCAAYENLYHDCFDANARGFNIRKSDTDGKDVWRNFARRRFFFCPFCGTRLIEETS